MKKKTIGIFLCILMIVPILATTAIAEDTDEESPFEIEFQSGLGIKVQIEQVGEVEDEKINYTVFFSRRVFTAPKVQLAKFENSPQSLHTRLRINNYKPLSGDKFVGLGVVFVIIGDETDSYYYAAARFALFFGRYTCFLNAVKFEGIPAEMNN